MSTLCAASAKGKPLEEPRLDHNFVGIKNLNNYTGYTYDYVLDLYFAQNRFYNADTRQFITQDPIKDGMNWYVYCEGNPLVNVDWLGYWTLAVGVEANASIMGRYAWGRSIIIDDDWNIGVIEYQGVGSGFPAASIGLTFSWTNADKIVDTTDESLISGATIAANWGAELVAGNAQDGSTVIGVTASAGLGTPFPEVHSEVVWTKIISQTNILDEVSNMVDGAIEWYFDNFNPFQRGLKDILTSTGILPMEAYAAECGVDRSVKNINAPANLNKVKMEREKVTTNIANDVRANTTGNIAGKATATVPKVNSSANTVNKATSGSSTKASASVAKSVSKGASVQRKR